MNGVVIAGAVIGLGAALILSAATARRPSLAEDLAFILAPPPARPQQPPPGPAQEDGGWAARLGRPGGRLLAALGLPTAKLRGDLALVERPVGRHLAEQAALTITGLLSPLLVVVVLAPTGLHPPAVPVAVFCLLGAAAGFVLADVQVRAQARARRHQLRHALAAFLDLMVICLSGGAGVDQALHDATTIPQGWAATQLRDAIATARLTRRTPWEALAALGEHTRVSELSELAATLTLAGTEGARIRASLTARAAGMRVHQLAATETHAEQASERMSVPVVVLFAGFLVFLGFPALTAALAGL